MAGSERPDRERPAVWEEPVLSERPVEVDAPVTSDTTAVVAPAVPGPQLPPPTVSPDEIPPRTSSRRARPSDPGPTAAATVAVAPASSTTPTAPTAPTVPAVPAPDPTAAPAGRRPMVGPLRRLTGAATGPAPARSARSRVTGTPGATVIGMAAGIVGAWVALSFVQGSLGEGSPSAGTQGGRGSAVEPLPSLTPYPTATLGEYQSLPATPLPPGPMTTLPVPAPTFTPPTPPPTFTPPPPPTFTPPTGTPTPVESQAATQLAALRDGDRSSVQFRGQWTPMLASKWVGVRDPLQVAANGSNRFQAADILAEHNRLRSGANLGARVVLVLSTDFGTGRTVDGKPLWMTFALTGSTSKADAQAWCTRRFPGLTGSRLANVCTPWQLSPPRNRS